jgi:uncharacterized protein (TIGR02996 family)
MRAAEGFLKDIIAHPGENTPRRIFADWLEENGDPDRAEFIRLQCELAQLTEDDDRRWDLEEREGQLLRRHGKGWAGPIRHLVKRWQFRRGFVEAITIRAADFLEHADDLFRLAPVCRVRLLDAPGQLADLARSPHLGRLEGIDLRHNQIPLTRFKTLIRSRRLGELKSLGLRGTNLCNRQGWTLLGSLEQLSSLTSLDVSDHHTRPRTPPYTVTIDADAMRELAESPHLTSLTALSIAGYRFHLDPSAMEALADSPLLGRLTYLDLSDSLAHGGDPGDLDLLARSPRSAGLRVLRYRWSGLGRTKSFVDVRALSKPHVAGGMSHAGAGDERGGARVESRLSGPRGSKRGGSIQAAPGRVAL